MSVTKQDMRCAIQGCVSDKEFTLDEIKQSPSYGCSTWRADVCGDVDVELLSYFLGSKSHVSGPPNRLVFDGKLNGQKVKLLMRIRLN